MTTLDILWKAKSPRVAPRIANMDYKKKLREKTATSSAYTDVSLDVGGGEGSDAEAYRNALRRLSSDEGVNRVVFQSMAVTVLQLLEKTYGHLCESIQAALSLGQQDKLKSMEGEVRAAMRALRSLLSEQGSQMLDLCVESEEASSPEGSWWFALSETIEHLEEGTQQMESLERGQPDGPARELARIVGELLRKQHADLLVEADEWIS